MLIPVAAIPDTAKVVPATVPTVALGEVTGHAHGWQADDGVALLEAPDGTVYVDNPHSAPLTHGHLTDAAIVALPVPEHSTLPAPKLAEVRQQVEYAEEDIRAVAD